MGAAQREILGETFGFLSTHLPLLLGLAVLMAVAIAAESLLRRGVGERGRRRLFLGLVGAAVALGLTLAWQVLWLADDAFISFRYARNLARGWGLVFNQGEWVEGYTNFLWTALLGGLGWLGADIPYAGLFGCLLCFAAALVAVAVTVRKVAVGPQVIPFAALALAGSAPFYTFASSGLETMPLALLGVVAMWVSTLRRGALLAGLVLVLAAMTRPDFLLIYGCMGLALVVEDLCFGEGRFLRRIDWGRLTAFAVPFVFVYLPYFMIRWRVYGDIFPNTYYAKSGGLSYFRQGSVYLFHFMATTGGWIWLPLFGLSLAGRPRDRNETRLRAFALLSALIYGGYVVKVGGDFMEHRFLVPLLPLIAVAAEISLRHHLRRLRSPGLALAGVAVVSLAVAVALLPIRLIGPYQLRWMLAAEHTFYPVKKLIPLRVGSGYVEEGEALHRALVERGLRPHLVGAAIGMLGYYSDLPLVDALGLTNRRIAHKRIHFRGRPGHEKGGTVEEIVEEGGILAGWPMWGERWASATRVEIDGRDLYFVRLDSEVSAAIEKIPGAKVPDPGAQVRRLVRERPREEVLEALPFYRIFLQGRPDREALLSALEGRLRSVLDFEEEELPPQTTSFGRGLKRVSGVAPPGASGTGWLSSLPDRGDGTGRLEVTIPSLDADELRFVLGGAASEKLTVRLLVEGAVAREARPQGGQGLSPVAWSLAELRGRQATLVIEDADPAPGIGLLLDGVHFGAGMGDVRERLARWRGGEVDDPAALIREAERLLPGDDPDRLAIGEQVEARWTLAALPEGTALLGEAFGRGPIRHAIPGQRDISGGNGGALLNSYQPGDRALGRVEFPERELSGGPIVVLVGGGASCSKTYVGLEVDGVVVKRVCGKNDETLRPMTLDTAKWKGRRGRLVAVDESKDGWGHILLGDVIFLRPGR